MPDPLKALLPKSIVGLPLTYSKQTSQQALNLVEKFAHFVKEGKILLVVSMLAPITPRRRRFRLIKDLFLKHKWINLRIQLSLLLVN